MQRPININHPFFAMPYPVLCRTEWGVLSDQACSDAA